MIDEVTLEELETRHQRGLTSAEILGLLASHSVPLSEATLRKYVQLGLLPRSVRVGRKGKHRGSQGIYPVGVLRQILRIRAMLAQDYTIEQIQREVLFVRSDLEQLERTLGEVYHKLERVLSERAPAPSVLAGLNELRRARSLGEELLGLLLTLENRLTSGSSRRAGAELERARVS